jgi:hypothetical protein
MIMDGSAAIAVEDSTRLTRTTNPAATDKIAQLRQLIDNDDERWHLICDILQDLNEVPLYR